jgi:hypothetical protein
MKPAPLRSRVYHGYSVTDLGRKFLHACQSSQTLERSRRQATELIEMGKVH